MALTSTLGSPGIEIREVDNSYRLDSSTATTVYIPGFAAQGPVDEVMSIGTISDFETIYGVPTNAAERYFYYTVKSVLDNSGSGVTVLTSRLPYGSGKGDTVSNAYTLLAYPAVPVIKKQHDKIVQETVKTDTSEVYYFTDTLSVERTRQTKTAEWSAWAVKEGTTTTTNYTFNESDLTLTDADGTIISLPTSGKETFDFDQFTSSNIHLFENQFNVYSTPETNTPVGASIEEFVLTLDDDSVETLKFTGLVSESEGTNDTKNYISIPAITEMIDFSASSTSGHANAPELIFADATDSDSDSTETYSAKGTMAT